MLRNQWNRWINKSNVKKQPIRKRPGLQMLQLEDRVTPANTTFAGNLLTINFDNINESVTINNDGTNISLSSSHAITGAGSSFATSSVKQIVVTDSGSLAGQTLTVANALTLSDGFSSTGVETVVFNAAVNAGGGSAAINVNATTQIVVNPGANLTGGSGGVTLIGGGSSTGNTKGVTVNNATITTTGNGNVTVTGTGGTAGIFNHGVLVTNAGQISAGGTGTVSVTGIGGASAGASNHGVYVQGGGQITSNGGSVTVTGTGGGTAASSNNFGIFVEGLSSQITSGSGGNLTATGQGGVGIGGFQFGVVVFNQAQISSVGSGTVTVTGTGGASTGSNNYGVYVVAPGATITSGGAGQVKVTGIAGGGSGSSGSNYGVYILSAVITGGSGAEVKVIGTSAGHATSTGDNVGIYLDAGVITSAGGNVSVTGSGGKGTTSPSHGVLAKNSSQISSGSTGTVTVTGTGGAGSASQNHGVNVILGSQISSGGAGTVSITGTGGGDSLSTSSNNIGTFVDGTNSKITSGGGNVTVVGLGGAGIGGGHFGIAMNNSGQISSGGSGTVQLVGTGGASSGNSNIGVYLVGSNTIVTSGGSGHVTVTGTGGGGSGTSGGNYGVTAFSNAKITSGTGANVTVTGSSPGHTGSSGLNHGVFLNLGEITSGGGNVTVTGTGGLGATNFSTGVSVINSAKINATGTGSISVTGTGGNGTANSNFGVLVAGGGQIFGNTGNPVTVTGTGGGTGSSTNNKGVLVDNGVLLSFNTLTVLGNKGTGSSDGISVINSSSFGSVGLATLKSTNSSNITAQAAASVFLATLNVDTGGNVDIIADSPVSLDGTNIVGGNLILSSNGSLLDNSGSTLTVIGTTQLSAIGSGIDIILDGNNDFQGAVSVTTTTANSVELNDISGGLTLAGVNATSSILRLTTVGGLFQTGPIQAKGIGVRNSGSGNIDLGTHANIITSLGHFAASNTAAGASVAYQSNGSPFRIGTVPVGSSFTATSGITTNNGAVTITSPGAVGLEANVASTGGAINLGTGGDLILFSNSSISSGSNTITIGRSIQADLAANDRELTVNAGTGAATLLNVGTSQPVKTLNLTSGTGSSVGAIIARSGGVSITSTGITLNGDVSGNGLPGTPGPINITGAVTLGNDLFIVSNSGPGGTVTFGPGSTIDGSMNLTIAASTGPGGSLTLNNTVIGGVTPLTTLSLTGLDISGSNNITTTGGITTTSGSATSLLSGIISGAGTFIKNGTGTLTLSGFNTYTGTTTINAGTLVATNASSIGAASGMLDLAGGTLAILSDSSLAFNKPVTVSADSTIQLRRNSGSGTLDHTFTTLSIGSNQLTVTNDSSITSSDNIVRFTGPASFTGNPQFNVQRGTSGAFVQVRMVGGVTDGGVARTITFNNSGLAGETIGWFEGSRNLTTNTQIDFTGNQLFRMIVVNQDLNDQATYRFANTFGGGAILDLRSDSDATFNNNLILDAAGIVRTSRISSDAATNRTIGSITINGNKTLTLQTGANVTVNNPYTFNAAGATINNGTAKFVPTNNGTGLATLAITGSVTGTGAIQNLAMTGSGQLTLSGTNTYTGATTVTGGKLTAANGLAIPDASAVTVGSGGTLNLADSETIGSLAGAGSVTLGSNTLTTGGNNTNTTYMGVISGTGGSLIKEGTGTFTLTAANTYTGTTTVNAGTLLVNGAHTGTGAVSVNSGATLGGTGTLPGSVSVNTGGSITGGILGGVGTLTVGSLTFNGGTYQADFNGNTSDTILTAGTINLNAGTPGTFTVNSQTGTTTAGNVFTLINNTATGAITNTPLTGAAEAATITINGKTTYASYVGGDGNNFTLTTAGAPVLSIAGNAEVRQIISSGKEVIQLLQGSTIVDSRPLVSITGVYTVTGSAGDDTLTINYSTVSPANGYFQRDITFNAGAGNDTLNIVGGSFGTTVYNYLNANDGDVKNYQLPGMVTLLNTITYTGLTPLTNSGTAADIIFNLPATASNATLQDSGTQLNLSCSVPTFENTTFTPATNSTTINRGNADDKLTIGTVTNLVNTLTVGSSGNNFSQITQNGLINFVSNMNLTYWADEIYLNNNIKTIAGNVNLNGSTKIQLTKSVEIETKGGNILVNTPDVETSALGFDFSLSTVASTAGNITINGTLEGLYNDLNIDARSSTGSDGIISFTKTSGIGIFGQSVTGDPASVTIAGDVHLASVTTIDVGNNSGPVASGSIDLSQAQFSGSNPSVNMLLFTSTFGSGTGPSGDIQTPHFGKAGGHKLLLVEAFANKGTGSAAGTITIDTGRVGNSVVTNAGSVSGNFLAWGGTINSNTNLTADTFAIVASNQIVDGNGASVNFTGNKLQLRSAGAGQPINLQTDVNTVAAKAAGNITLTNSKFLTIDSLTYSTAETTPTIFTTNGIDAVGQTVDLKAPGITQTAAGIITSANLRLQGTGNFTLTKANDVDVLAADVTGNLSFTDTDDLTIGTVLGTNGLSTKTAAGGNIAITAPNLILAKNIDTQNGNVTLTASNNTVLSADVVIDTVNSAAAGGSVTVDTPELFSVNGGFYDLTINTSGSTTGGNVTFTGDIAKTGGVDADFIGDLLINAKGATPATDGVVEFTNPLSAVIYASSNSNNLDPGSVTIQGDLRMPAGSVIDVSSKTAGVHAGSVNLQDARLKLTLSAGSFAIFADYLLPTPTGNGGDVQLPYFDNSNGNFFTMEVYASTLSTGGTGGTVTITTGRANPLATDAGSITGDFFIEAKDIVSNAKFSQSSNSTIAMVAKNAFIDGNGATPNFAGTNSNLLIIAGTAPLSLQTTGIGKVAFKANGNITYSNDQALTVGTISYTPLFPPPPAPYSASGINSTSNNVTINNTGLITLVDDINAAATGVVDINSQGVIETTGVIKASALRLQGTGPFTLNNNNEISTFAADVTGNLSLKTITGLTIGTVLGTNGVTVNSGNFNLVVDGVGNDLAINKAVNVPVGSATMNVYGSINSNASGSVIAKNNISLTFGTNGSNNTFNAVITSATGAVSLTGGNGGDTITTNAAITAGPGQLLSVSTGSGDDTLTFNSTLNGGSILVQTGAGDDTIDFNGNVTATGGTITINSGADDDTITINATVSATGLALVDGGTGTDLLTILGTSGNDTFDINKTFAKTALARGGKFEYDNVEVMDLSTFGGKDIFEIGFGNYAGATGFLPATVNILAGADDDLATIYMPAGNNITPSTWAKINWLDSSAAVRGGETVTYTPALEQLVIQGNTGQDWFYARPSTAAKVTQITIRGDLPTSATPPGDKLQLDVSGLTAGMDTTNAKVPDGKLTGPAISQIDWTGIESLPVPLGLGGSFDLGRTISPAPGNHSPIQETGTGINADPLPSPSNLAINWLGVDASETFVGNGNIYGWDLATQSFVRYTNDPIHNQSLPPGPNRDLLQDGHYWQSGLANKRNFQVAVAPGSKVWVSVFVGDQAPLGGTSGEVWIEGTKYDTFSVPNGKFYRGRFLVQDSGDGRLDISIFQPMLDTWSLLNGVDVRPEDWLAPITMTRQDGDPNPVAADNFTIDKYNFANAQPNQVFTVTATLGNLVNFDGTPLTDVDPSLNGIQIQADATGKGFFYLKRPGTGSNSSFINLVSAYGDAALQVGGVFTAFEQKYFSSSTPTPLAPSFKFDFNSAITKVTQTDYTPVYFNTLYGGPNAFGWAMNSTNFDRTNASTAFNGSTKSLNRDGHMQTVSNTFTVNTGTPSKTYSITVYLGEPAAVARRGMTVSVATGTMIGGTPTFVSGSSPTAFVLNPTLPYSPAVGSGTAYFTSTQTYVVSPTVGGTVGLTFQATTDSAGLLGLTFGLYPGVSGWWNLQGIEMTPVSPLMPMSSSSMGVTLADQLSQGPALQSIVDEAISRWAGAGLSAAQLAQLRNVKIEVTNLPGGELGVHSPGRITLDDDGAGRGWFIDPTPSQDEEFIGGWSVATTRYDLLTVIMHELGHELGLRDLPRAGNPTLMTDNLALGERRSPTSAEVSELVPLTVAEEEFVPLQVVRPGKVLGPAPAPGFNFITGLPEDEVSLLGVAVK